MQKLYSNDLACVKDHIARLVVSSADSHKGQNGKVLVVGGSTLFHASVIWSARVASHFVDMVHFSSTRENNEIMTRMKELFNNGIVVSQHDIAEYLQEDDAVLLGPGMMRDEQYFGSGSQLSSNEKESLKDILEEKNEGILTARLTHHLLQAYPAKQFVLDAGALQMMKLEWIRAMTRKPILTPHQGEFERLFGVQISSMDEEEKIRQVQLIAQKHNCIILLKAIIDIISDGEKTYVVYGGNAGLTKGGTGDILAGLITSFAAVSDPLTACIASSYTLKRTSDHLSKSMGYWYNNDDIIATLPQTLHRARVDLKLV